MEPVSIIKPKSTESTPNGTPNPAMMRVTADMATQWLETMKYDHQRSIRQRHVEFLADEMRRERFIQGTQIRFVSLGGQRMLVDGQHRLWAVVTSEIPQYFSVLTTRVENKEEAAWIYGNTDVGMRRTGSDLHGALDLENEFRITKTQLAAFSASIIYMTAGCLRINKSIVTHRDDIVRLMRLYAPFARQYFDLTIDCEKRVGISLRRAATMGVGLLTMRFSLPYAESRGDPSVAAFWTGAIFDNGIQIGDARKLVNRHLQNARIISTFAQPPGSSIVTADYSSRYIAVCFNAYMGRRDLKHGKVLDAKSPLNLYGVPDEVEKWW